MLKAIIKVKMSVERVFFAYVWLLILSARDK